MQLSRLLISNLAFTRARKMDTYLLLASETDPVELSSHSENVLVLHDRYSQEALRYMTRPLSEFSFILGSMIA